MIEITKENMDNANFVDKEYLKGRKFVPAKKMSTKIKFLIYTLSVLFVLTISYIALINSFLKTLASL